MWFSETRRHRARDAHIIRRRYRHEATVRRGGRAQPVPHEPPTAPRRSPVACRSVAQRRPPAPGVSPKRPSPADRYAGRLEQTRAGAVSIEAPGLLRQMGPKRTVKGRWPEREKVQPGSACGAEALSSHRAACRCRTTLHISLRRRGPERPCAAAVKTSTRRSSRPIPSYRLRCVSRCDNVCWTAALVVSLSGTFQCRRQPSPSNAVCGHGQSRLVWGHPCADT